MKYTLLLLFLFSSTIFAVESTDVLQVNVIKAYDKNILVINRGLEDGIYKADHIKLTNDEGYIARAICIKASMLISHWKVYRVVRPELLSYDSQYKLTSMNQSEIPKDMKGFQKANYRDQFNDFTDKDVKKEVEMQQERIASFDLPKDMEYDPLFKEANTTDGERFIKKNFNLKKMSEDLAHYKLSFYSSPYQTESRTNQKQIHYGVSAQNIGDKYLVGFEYERRESTKANQYNNDSITSESNKSSAHFILKDFSENTDYYMLYQARSAKIGGLANPKSHSMIAPVGFRFNLQDKESKDIFNISYLLILDDYKYEYYENGSLTDGSMNNIRHGLNLEYQTLVGEQSKFLLSGWYRPYMELDKQEIDFGNSLTEITATYAYGFTKELFLEYAFTYTNDINLDRIYNINPVNQINTLNFRYNLDL